MITLAFALAFAGFCLRGLKQEAEDDALAAVPPTPEAEEEMRAIFREMGL